MSDPIKADWEQYTKQELAALAKWHEARADAFKEVIEMLTTDPEAVKYEVSVPEHVTLNGGVKIEK